MLVAAVVILVWQHREIRRLKSELSAAHELTSSQAAWPAEIDGLTKQLRAVTDRSKADGVELARLRGQVATLRQLERDHAQLKAEHDELIQKSRQTSVPSSTTNPFDETHGPGAGAKANYAKHWGFALLNYAANHQEQFPASFEQAQAFLHDELSAADARVQALQATEQFEILFQGSRDDLSKLPPESTIIIREKQAWVDKEGLWCKAYGMSDGSSMIRQSPKNDFEHWESIRLPTRKVSYPSGK